MEVAKAVGVAPSTVSRAFTRPELLRPETVARIRTAADELGYVPNNHARALITGRSAAIGVIVPDIANPFFPPLIRHLQSTAEGHGLAVFVADTDERADREAQLIGRLTPQVEGLVLASSRISEESLITVAERQPVVLINRDVPGTARILVTTSAAQAEGLAELVRSGRRRVAYVAGPRRSWSDGERRQGLRRTAADLPVELVEIDPDDSTFASGQASVGEVLARGCDAVIAFDDVLAHGVVTGLLAAGLAVPDDVAVLGCDDILAITTHPPLSSIALPLPEAATAAIEALLDVDRRGRVRETRIEIPGRLVLRGTT